jgi:hypothetical protein
MSLHVFHLYSYAFQLGQNVRKLLMTNDLAVCVRRHEMDGFVYRMAGLFEQLLWIVEREYVCHDPCDWHDYFRGGTKKKADKMTIACDFTLCGGAQHVHTLSSREGGVRNSDTKEYFEVVFG